jgi:hypothetical protein
LVEGGQALADVIGADADDGVGGGIVGVVATKDFDADDALLEEIIATLEGPFDDVFKELASPAGAAELFAGDDLGQMPANRFGLFPVEDGVGGGGGKRVSHGREGVKKSV